MPTENYKWHGMKQLLAVLALMVPAGGLVHANDAPEPTTNTPAQARQFGIFFGGTASQYDLCVKKGFLPKGNQSAEEIAKSFYTQERCAPVGKQWTKLLEVMRKK